MAIMRKRITEMSPTEISLRLTRKFGATRALAEGRIRSLVPRKSIRQALNKIFNGLNADEQAVFQNLTCKAFRDYEPEFEDAFWKVGFAGREIKMPLRSGSMWLDWDNAVSITGHDPEIKQTYENILRSKWRPKVFFDIGANYGTHSLLFLKHDVKAISFEPNPECIAHFKLLCELNDVDPNVVQCAVGDHAGTVNFWFPKRDTWLGTMVETTKEFVTEEHDVEQLSVELITIDQYVSENNVFPDLMKIDTEGNELNVIKGAQRTIAESKPFVIFESNRLSDRNELIIAFEALNYGICGLPFDFESKLAFIDAEQFAGDERSNFIALPKVDKVASV